MAQTKQASMIPRRGTLFQIPSHACSHEDTDTGTLSFKLVASASKKDQRRSPTRSLGETPSGCQETIGAKGDHADIFSTSYVLKVTCFYRACTRTMMSSLTKPLTSSRLRISRDLTIIGMTITLLSVVLRAWPQTVKSHLLQNLAA